MFEDTKLSSAFTNLSTWAQNNVLTMDAAIQSVWVIAGFIVGYILARFVNPHIENYINTLDFPLKAKRVLNSVKKLITPTAALIIIALASLVMPLIIDINITLSMIVMKLLLAWIGIRLCLQFINNSWIRNIFALTIWAIAALSIFGVLDQTHDLLDSLGFSIGNFRISALIVIKGVLSLFFLLYFAAFISSFLERRVLGSKGLTRSSQVLIAKIIRITLIVVAVLIGITNAGIDLSVFAVFSGAVGLGLGFGLQKVASNLFSGFLLLTDQSIKPGDVIELEDSGTFGWVNNMAARYTEIVTRDNKSYLIPNEDFITQKVVNWSHGNNLVRLDVEFGVHYDSNPHDVIAVASAAASAPERVVSSPAPVCWITEFADSSINFSLRFWIRDAEGGVTNVKGEVLLALWDAFQENNISIPYPHREVYIHNMNDKA